jgi:hypothetical protein
LINPGEYPAKVEKNFVRLTIPTSNGKTKEVKLRIISVSKE